MQLLAPLAPTLEKLDLGDNKLGGTVTADIAAFTKLTELVLYNMGLEGASRGLSTYTAQKRIKKQIATEAKFKLLCAHPRTGQLPSELGQLTNLQTLDVAFNMFSGAA